MPRAIPNTTVTSVQYSQALTFAGTDIFEWGYITVANNPVFAQLLEGQQGQATPQDEQYLPPATYPITSKPDRPVAGIRFRANSLATPLPQVFGNLYYPADPGIQAGTPYTGVVSPAGAVGVGVGVLNRDTSLVDVQASNAETAIYSFLIPAATVSADSMLRLTCHGDVLFNNAVGNTLRFRVRLGGSVPLAGTIIFSDDRGAVGAVGAVRQPFRWSEEIPMLGALNSELLNGSFIGWAPDTTAPTTGQGVAGLRYINTTPGQGSHGSNGPVAIDMSVANLLELTVQWSAASANNSFRKRYAILELL